MKWEISVAGYGSYTFVGTEQEAEAERRRKALAEQAVARKRRAE